VDLSGVQILLGIVERLRGQGKQVALSGLANVEAARPGLHELFVQLEVLSTVGEDHLHATLDLAREAYEDELLEPVHTERRGLEPLALSDFEAFASLNDEELRRFSGLLEERSVAEGEDLYTEGEPAKSFVLVRDGRLSVTKKTATGEVRLAALGRGTSWGIRALVEGGNWRNTLRAASDVKVFELQAEAVRALAKNHPQVCEHLERELLRTAMLRMDLLTTELVNLEEA
jgi:CRP-like cAMP-binding protein